MTKSQFEKLQPGMPVEVKFTFKYNIQIVVSTDPHKGTITTKVEETGVQYVYPFEDINYIPQISHENINAMRSIQDMFIQFAKDCDNCPFGESCSVVYDRTDHQTYEVLNLCDLILKNL